LDKRWLSVGQITLFGMLAALTFGAKVAMSTLPNIEPVTLMMLVMGAVFGWKAVCPMWVYVTAEILFYGLGTWNFNYLYIWIIPVALGVLLRQIRNPFVWALVSGVYGLLFGALCAPVYLAAGGIHAAISWWISGIPYDIIHGVSNFVMALVLFAPLRRVLERLWNK
jgi:energy-coupling factor transport system substrate-specific component